jgi:hypothetical protein
MERIFGSRNLYTVTIPATVSLLVLASVTYALVSHDGSEVGPPRAEPSPAMKTAPSPSTGKSPVLSTRTPSARPTTTSNPPATASPETSTPPTDSSPPAEQKPKGSALIRWIREFAPAGGGDKSPYISFMLRDCAATLDAALDSSIEDGVQPLDEPWGSLYEGVAAACLAGLQGRGDYWPLAVKKFPAVDPSRLDCWEREIHAIYRTLIEAHRAQQRIELSDEPAGTSGCPELIGFDPGHGSRSGGYSVTVVGRNLPPVLVLDWFELGVEVQTRRDENGRMTVVVPAAEPDEGSAVTVRISDAPRIEGPYHAVFEYDD